MMLVQGMQKESEMGDVVDYNDDDDEADDVDVPFHYRITTFPSSKQNVNKFIIGTELSIQKYTNQKLKAHIFAHSMQTLGVEDIICTLFVY